MITYKVEEMSCNHCVSRIEKALTEAGIGHKVSLENKTVTIEDEQNNGEKAVEILDDLGFSAIAE